MKITKEQFKKIVKEVLTEENEYQAFFQKALDKAGKSIPSMSEEEKKAFFDKIDAAWNGKGEKNEELVGGQKELDVDGDGEIEGSDLAKLRANKDESVNEASFMDIDRKSAAISNITQLEKNDIKKFIENNNLDATKIHIFVQKNYPKNAQLFVKLTKNPNSSALKNFKNESVNEAETQKIVKDEDAKKSFMKHLEMNNKSIQKMADFHKVTPDRIVKGLEKFIRILHIEAPNGKPTVFSISLKLKEPKSKVSVNDGFVYDENGKQYKYNGPF
jgi:hypothetical protein